MVSQTRIPHVLLHGDADVPIKILERCNRHLDLIELIMQEVVIL